MESREFVREGGNVTPFTADSPAVRGRPLYSAYYGLTESPFDLTPNSRFLFVSNVHSEALANLRYALGSPKGFTLLLGEAGTGKTTLVRTALAEFGDTQFRYVLVSNPTLGRAEFYEYLARSFGLSEQAGASKSRFLFELEQDVVARFAAGGLTGIIIDEAQSMPHDLLEEVRLMGNIETPTTRLLNIVLSGQPELADRLNEPSLRQLKQRIALRCELKALTHHETSAYIAGRLRIAGGMPERIFTQEAVARVYQASLGNPRTVNVICDNALISGFAAQIKPITAAVVNGVCHDFDLEPVATSPRELDAAGEPHAAPAPPPLRGAASARGPRMLTASEDLPQAANPGRKRLFNFF